MDHHLCLPGEEEGFHLFIQWRELFTFITEKQNLDLINLNFNDVPQTCVKY